MKVTTIIIGMLIGLPAFAQTVITLPESAAADPAFGIIEALPFSETTSFWVLFIIAVMRGLAATIAEWVPNNKLGPFVGVIDFIGGNNKNAEGSQ